MSEAKKIVNIGNLEITLISEHYDGRLMDTKVMIGEQNLCFISGSEINNFLNELTEVINNYRI